MADNPFADSDDDIDRTVLRPAAMQRPPLVTPSPTVPPIPVPPPPGPFPAAPSGPPPRYAPLDQTIVAALARGATNPLLSAAAPLLALVVRVRDLTIHSDAEGLRERVIAEMKRFEEIAVSSGLPADQIRIGRYALCATIDDVVLATPWGEQSSWSHRSMVSTIHKETFGGERFFDLLEQMQAEPKRYLQELELFYVCLSLGFEGKFRVMPRGANELSRLRDVIYRLIMRERGEDPDPDLAPRWRGVTERFRPLDAVVPLWVVFAVLGALLAILFTGLAITLGEKSDLAATKMAAVIPNKPVAIARLTPPPPPAPQSTTVLQRVTQFMEPDIQQGTVEVFAGDDNSVVIRLKGPLMFASASDTLGPAFVPIINRVGQALAAEKGRIVIQGHTDSQPIRTVRFSSNQALSAARAETVLRMLTPFVGADRMTAEGLASSEPIATNATPQGRLLNRRVEVVLYPQ